MAAFGRPDKRGRSSAALMPKDRKLLQLPAPFVAVPLEVLRSDAWRGLGIHARRVLDALLVEHVAHRGLENGRLVAPYDQLEKDWGISRRKIAGAIRELEQRGLVQRVAIGHGNRRTGERAPSLYRLTFLASLPDRLPASNEWRAYSAPRRSAKTDRPVSLSDTTGCHAVAPRRVARGGTHGG